MFLELLLIATISYNAQDAFSERVSQELPCFTATETAQRLLHICSCHKPRTTFKKLLREYPFDKDLQQAVKIAKETGYW